MNSRERFLKACQCQLVDRPPVWLMRQAGRYLPEYQSLRAKHSLLEMFTTTELVVEASLQPWRRFGMDAVIVFSDILIPSRAMGMKLDYVEGKGPQFSPPICAPEEIQNLKSFDPFTACPFLYDGLNQLRKTLGDRAALIGFCGTPWTTAYYMLEKEIGVWKKERPKDLKRLLTILTRNLSEYLLAQVESGVDAIQLFDSWGGLLGPEEYEEWSGIFVATIIHTLKTKKIPVILFVKESAKLLQPMLQTEADVLSIGIDTDLASAAQVAGNKVAVQGNLDSEILLKETPAQIQAATKAMLQQMRGRAGYIANLGHGVLPKTPVENVAMFVNTVQESSL